jgi:RNA polymerase sigma-70 factor (ECF subfamily)
MDNEGRQDDRVRLDEQFLRLLMGNQDKIYTYILSMVHNMNDADDVMQDVVTVMWRKFDDYQEGSSFLAWSITIARYLVLKFFEKNRRSRIPFSDELAEKIASVTTNKLESYNERLEALEGCMKKLSPENQELIKMRYYSKTPTKAIAVERGILPHKMYRYMAKIHQMLQDCVRRTLSTGKGM